MSTSTMDLDERIIGQSPNLLHEMSQDFRGLTGDQIEAANRTALNLQLTKFMFHAWASIDNTYVGGRRGNLKYTKLQRLSLIPLYPWPYKKIVNRTSGHVSGDIISGNVKVGTRQEPRTLSVDDSEQFIIKAYGKMSGIRTLESLTTSDDEGRREAFMLFHAAMETRREPVQAGDYRPGIRGIDVVMQDLPTFMVNGAPQALRYAIEQGSVPVPDYLLYVPDRGRYSRSDLFPQDVYEFPKGAMEKGMAMIREIGPIISVALNMAAGPNGILIRSRNEINAARNGQRDAKMQKDALDLWLSSQNPDFGWDTEVDRMREANAPLLRAVEQIGVRPVGSREDSEEAQLRMERVERAYNERITKLEADFAKEYEERMARMEADYNERIRQIQVARNSLGSADAATDGDTRGLEETAPAPVGESGGANQPASSPVPTTGSRAKPEKPDRGPRR